MWVQLILSKLQDMTFVAAEDENWPLTWDHACTKAASRKERKRYADVIGRYTALVEMRHASSFGRDKMVADISKRHAFGDRANVASAMEDFWGLFLESSADADANLIWPDALMREIDLVYRMYFPDGWDFKTEENEDEDGEVTVQEAWRESIEGYYEDVTELVLEVWKTARDKVPQADDETRWERLNTAQTKWKWVRQWTSMNPYYDFPLPTRTFLHEAFTKFVALQDAFGWVSISFSPSQAWICVAPPVPRCSYAWRGCSCPGAPLRRRVQRGVAAPVPRCSYAWRGA